jgi:hypothetical protein
MLRLISGQKAYRHAMDELVINPGNMIIVIIIGA